MRVGCGWHRPGALALAVLAALCGCDGGAPADAPPAAAGDAPRPAAAAVRAATVAAVDEAEAERLAALGYADVAENDAPDLPVGVLERDEARMQPGLTFFTNALGCSASLVTSAGEEVRRWSLEPCDRWGNGTLLADGSVLAIHRNPAAVKSADPLREARELVKLDWDGRLLWRRRLPAHHDVDLRPDGRIATLLYDFRVIPEIDPAVPVRDDAIGVLSGEGEILEQRSITELLLRAEGYPMRMRKPHRFEKLLHIDLVHANSIEWMHQPHLEARSDLYAASNVLVCLRNQDAVIAVDWSAKRVVWWWGHGILSGPHDATVLPDGHILVFDNGLNRGWSRAIEMDPLTGEVVWEYHAPEPKDLFTVQRGAAQRLANGNTLLTDSNAGVALEVTRAGESVWRFRNPNRSKGKPIVIVRARRVTPVDGSRHRFERSD
jgi:hypothetical protein